MSLTSGSRLGPYEITGPIGAGGMGEVFRARDTKLGRDVAIKVLPAAVAQDTERVGRFRREAQILATLNHPNIAAVYSFDQLPSAADGSRPRSDASIESRSRGSESPGTGEVVAPAGSQAALRGDPIAFLVMELVAGEDLAQRLRDGAVPIDETIAIARQIAEALEEAHEHGIVHRDLKPANVKVTPDGKVKVLDFGLAKAFEGDHGTNSGSGNLSHSPTMSRHATEAGMIMGTAAYMSPEQARGKAVDKRADIWSFGVVVFEMLTGERLFSGETVSDTLAAVLREDVPWAKLPAATPGPVARLLRRCLARDPRQRLRDMGEARMVLCEPFDAATATGPTPVSPATRPAQRSTPWSALVVIALISALAGAWIWARLRPQAPALVTRLTIDLPPGQIVAGNGAPAITRDGRTLAYVARDAAGVSRLYLRALDRFDSVLVPESETAQQPFFSPKGDHVGFFARGKLMTAPVSGGAATAIADASYQTFGATWGEDDAIVYVPTLMSGLLKIPSSGGKPQNLTEPDSGSKGYAHAFPHSLPGGRGLVFSIWGGVNMEGAGTAFLPSGSTTWTKVSTGNWQSSFATSGHLLLGSARGNVTAIPWNPGRPAASAAPALVIEDVFTTPNLNASWYATSETGTLVYVPGDVTLGTLAWVDRNGTVSKIEEQPSRLLDVTLSPDGTRVAFVVDSIIWTMELRRRTLTRLTLDSEGNNRFATWSRDSSTLLFASNRGGEWDIHSVPANGGPAKLVLKRPGIQLPLSSSPDGTLLFAERLKGTSTDLFILSPTGEVTPFLISPASKVGGQFSPDGKLVAYVADDTGRDEVYVRKVARPDVVVAVSTNGGRSPRWSPDGKEIFYKRGDAFLVASVTNNPDLSVGDARKLFELQVASSTTTQQAGYAVAPDGQRFLVQLPDPRALPTRINVVLNWFEELKAKVR